MVLEAVATDRFREWQQKLAPPRLSQQQALCFHNAAYEKDRCDRDGAAVGPDTTARSRALAGAHLGRSTIRRRVGYRDGV
jgi:hypothetical protein